MSLIYVEPRNFFNREFAGSDIPSLKLEPEYVYTDSLFYMDHKTAKKLLAFYEKIGKLHCEIDAYGDFLQALGPGATVEYTKNTSNVTKEGVRVGRHEAENISSS